MGMKSSQAQVPDIYFFHEFAGCAPQLYDVVTIVSFFLIARAESIYNRSLFNYEGTTLCHSGFSSLMQFPTAEPRYFKAGLLDNLVLLSEWEGKLAKQTHSFIFIKENQAINNMPTFGGAFEAAGLECCV
jgi:hypothetical protein